MLRRLSPAALAALLLLVGGCVRERRGPRTVPPPGVLYTRPVEQRTIQAGQVLWIRVLEPVAADRPLPEVTFSGLIVRDVVDGGGHLMVPNGATVRLQVLAAPKGGVALALHSMRIYGNTYLLRPAEGEGAGWRPGMPLGALLDGTVSDSRTPRPSTALTVEGPSVQVPADALLLYRLERAALIE